MGESSNVNTGSKIREDYAIARTSNNVCSLLLNRSIGKFINLPKNLPQKRWIWAICTNTEVEICK